MNEYAGITDRSQDVLERTVLPCQLAVPNLTIFEGSTFSWDSPLQARGLVYANQQLGAACLLNYVERFQWKNKMIPNEGSTGRVHARTQRKVFGTTDLPDAPDGVMTSGITQPPLMTPLSLEVAQQLPAREKRDFLKKMFVPLRGYTEWAMDKRIDPNTGLFTAIHSFEAGMDDSPTWDIPQSEAYLGDPDIISRLARSLGSRAIGLGRMLTDGRHSSLEHRATNTNVLTNYLQLRRIRRLGYDIDRIRTEDDTAVLVNHLGFNAILDWSNHALRDMAEEIDEPGYEVSAGLQAKQDRLHQAIQTKLWHEDPADPSRSGYRSMNARTGELIEVETIDELFPLATPIAADRAEHLRNKFLEVYQGSCEAVAPRSEHYRAGCYWRGGDWPFAREVVNQGLELHGYRQEALEHRDRTLKRISEPGKYEFEEPRAFDGQGRGRGITDFGPTAGQDMHWVYLQKAV